MKHFRLRTALLSALTVCGPWMPPLATAQETGAAADSAGWTVVVSPAARMAEPEDNLAVAPTALEPVLRVAFDSSDRVPEPVEPLLVPPPADRVSEAGSQGIGDGCPANADPGAYWAIYRSIPFLRSEYEANPSYRHEATMELLTGHPRPVIVTAAGSVAQPPIGPVGPSLPPYFYSPTFGTTPLFFPRYRRPSVPLLY